MQNDLPAYVAGISDLISALGAALFSSMSMRGARRRQNLVCGLSTTQGPPVESFAYITFHCFIFF